MGSFGPPEMLIILLILVLLFGARKLPELARGFHEGLVVTRVDGYGQEGDRAARVR